MKKTFLAYYKPTVKQIEDMWKNALIVLDANVLLNLYRYSEASSKDLLRILGEISDRLWMPHQAGLEYQRNRFKTIREQSRAYKTVIEALDKVWKNLEKSLEGFKNHLLINTDEITKEIKEACKKCEKVIEGLRESHPNLQENDTIRAELDRLLDGKIGLPYDASRLSEIYKEGKTRYENKIPPGYEDEKNKDGLHVYGDLIIWFQMIDKASESKKSIIFVTDDDKEDWWEKISGETLGPRPELIQEMHDKAQTSFHMYSTLQFMRFADKYLSQKAQPKTIEEIEEIRKYDKSQSNKMATDLIGLGLSSNATPTISHDLGSLYDFRMKTLSEFLAGTSTMYDFRMKTLSEILAGTSTMYDFRTKTLSELLAGTSVETTDEQDTEKKDSDK